MQKTLKDFFEVYKPTVKGEKRFVDKHVVVKHKDRNGNGDDVFKATNVKSVDKSPEHGYNAGEDSAVYESSDQSNNEYHKKAKAFLVSKGYKVKKGGQDTNGMYFKDHGGQKLSASVHTGTMNLHAKGANHGHNKNSDYDMETLYQRHLKAAGLKEEIINEISTAAIKRYKGAALDNLNYHSKQWDRLAKLHSFTLGQEKAFKKHDDEAEKRYNGIRKANKRLGLPGHNLKEEILNELSKSTLGKYIKASSAAAVNHSMFDLPASQHIDDRKEQKKVRSNIFRKITNREKGINRATNKLVKEEQIDELSKSTLGSYIKKAGDERTQKSVSAERTWSSMGASWARKKAKQRKAGIDKAINKLVKEETDLQELSKKTLASYINKAAVKNLAHAGSLATQAHDKDENKRKDAEGTAKKLVNKLDGIHRATKRLAKD